MPAPKGVLTDKQKLWIEKYLIHFNATRAAKESGYSEKSAKFSGHENLKNPEIVKILETRLSEVHMSADEALVILAKQARGDLGEFIKDDGSLDLASARKKNLTHLIKSIGKRPTKSGTSYRIELYDAQSAIEKILRVHDKLPPGDVNINVKITNG